MSALLQIKDISKSFGGVTATVDVSLDIKPGEVHAIIGPNGAGKTTLVSQISGDLRPDRGEILFKDQVITGLPAYARALRGIARTFQITSVFHEFTLLQNVMMAAQAHQGHSFRFWDAVDNDTALQEPALNALSRVGLQEKAYQVASAISHGEHRQLELAMALATDPDLLLLDEPMAGTGREESARMIDLLKTIGGEKTVLLVEHDMDAVFALADRISVLVYGQLIATGTPEEIRNDENVRRAYLGEEAN